MAKSISLTGNFKVIESTGVIEEVNKQMNTTGIAVTEITSHVVKIAASTVDYAVNFGGVTNGEYIFLKSSTPVTLKINDTGNVGFELASDKLTILGSTNITALYITTGTLEATVDATIAGS